MKKIGLVTFYKDNYGSALQCFATKIFLESIGYECVLLDVLPPKNNKIKRIVRFFYLCIMDKNYFSETKQIKKAQSQSRNILSDASREKINDFVGQYLSPRTISYSSACQLSGRKDFKCFLVGSDQVWSAKRPINEIYLLKFVPVGKRIAFAASFGSNEIAHYNVDVFKKGLQKFKAISVREESGIENVNKLIGKDVSRIADPVVLLTRKEWLEKVSNSNSVQRPYIIVHFLNEPNEAAIYSINSLQSKTGREVICIGYNQSGFANIQNASFIDGDPFDYVKLISEAEYVCTDSFHTTMFSIIFKKQFFTFQRQYLHNNPQTSRITDLLKRYGLEYRFITDAKSLENPELFSEYDCDEMLKKERENATEFLRHAIGMAET